MAEHNAKDKIAKSFPAFAILAFAIVVAIIAGSLVIVFAADDVMDALVLASLLHVGLGMALGFLILIFGAAMVWLGVEAAYIAGAEGKGVSAYIASASPGLVFAVAGVLLVGFSLYKELRYETPAKKPPAAVAQTTAKEEPRQYYTVEERDLVNGTALLRWSFKPKPDDKEYREQYVVWRNVDPHNFYYFNPESRKFWGRLSKPPDGEPEYSALKPEDQRESIGDFDRASFPKPGPLPGLPDAPDDATIKPPDFLPIPRLGTGTQAGRPGQ